jgi:hypothetical protein
MQHFNFEVIEQKRWRVRIEAESEAEAVAQIKREQKAEEAYLIDTRLKIVCCNQQEK